MGDKKAYVCLRTCQVRKNDGGIRFYEMGEKDFFEECPPHFVAVDEIDQAGSDIGRVSESVLRDPEIFQLESLVSFYNEKYREDLSGLPRDYVVDKIMYNRHSPVEPLHGGSAQVLAQDFVAPVVTGGESGITVAMADEEVSIPAPPAANDDDSLDDLLGGE